MNTFVRIGIQGRETNKGLDLYHSYMNVSDSFFHKWFEIKRNSKNAPYHVCRAETREEIIQFLLELITEERKRNDRSSISIPLVG